MIPGERMTKPFTADFKQVGPSLQLELTNLSDQRLKCVEVLTVFLKDEDTPGGGPSRAHIKFEALASIQAKESIGLAHKTWIDGKPVNSELDQIARLQGQAGVPKLYVLDISWEDPDGKSQFQRIPVGH